MEGLKRQPLLVPLHLVQKMSRRPHRGPYLALPPLAAVGSRLRIVAVLSARTLAGHFILSQLLLGLQLGLGRLWRRLAGSASPLGAGDGLRARRNSLHIHLHLPIHWRARQKRSGDLAAAPGGSSAARGTHGSPRRGRLARALPPATLRPHSPRLGSGAAGRLGPGAGEERVAACPWSAGLQAPPGSPATPSASWRWQGASQPRAPASPGDSPEDLLSLSSIPDPRSSIIWRLLGAPWVFHLPSNLLNKVTGRTNQMGQICLATLAEIGNVRYKWDLAPLAADQRRGTKEKRVFRPMHEDVREH